MHEKTPGLPLQKPADAARTETGRFRRWIRKNARPLIGGLAFSAFAGTVFVVGTAQDNNQYVLYKQGKTGIGKFSPDGKIKAWHFKLGSSRGCDIAGTLQVLTEVREELNRRMEAGDSGSLEKLFDVERAAKEIYDSYMRNPVCAKDAGR